MLGTLISVDEERERVIMRADAGGERTLDREYIEEHLQYAYALTGHGMQSGTVTWAAVIGQPGDFSRNWSYTALSRAREPTQIYLVDEPTPSQQEREQIAPTQPPAEDRDALELIRRRMRGRDDEDLALEQLDRAEEQQGERADPDQDRAEQQQIAPAETQQPTAISGRQPVPTGAERSPVQQDAATAAGAGESPVPPAGVSPALERVYELDERLSVIATELKHPAIEDARAITRQQDTIAAVQREHDRDHKPNGWRDRSGHHVRVRGREQQLAKLRGNRDELLARTPDPQAVLEHAAELREEQQRLMRDSLDASARAIDEQLSSQPPWLQQTLGPEPEDERLRDRWRYAARETASYRIERRITDPQIGLGPDPGADSSYRAARRTIIDARRGLGLDQAREPDRELGY